MGSESYMGDMSDRYVGYSRVHGGIPSTFREEVLSANARAYHELHGRFIPQPRDSRILDVGCGSGAFLYYLKREGYQNYYGIDLCADSISFVQDHITEQCECIDMGQYLRRTPDTFDAIVMNEVVEHLPRQDVIAALTMVYGALKPMGILLVLVPNMENPVTVYTRWHDFTHETGYTQNSIRMVLAWAGFREMCVYGTAAHRGFSLKYAVANSARFITRKYLEIVFGYPRGGILFSKRILAIAKKVVS